MPELSGRPQSTLGATIVVAQAPRLPHPQRPQAGGLLIAAIAVAGALGTLARWGLGQLMLRWGATSLPYGTLAANLIGCFLLGLVMEAAARAQWMNGELRIVLSVGFIGALTTFSTWEFETFRLARRGDALLAAGNFAVNIVFGFLLLWAGARLLAVLWR